MDVPYMLITRQLEDLKVYVCLCLVDHTITTIALTREEALNKMCDEWNAKNNDTVNVAIFSRN